MKTLVLLSAILLIVGANVISEDSSKEQPENPRYRQVRNQEGGSSGSRPNRRPPPPAYYVETPSESGRRVYQINRADEKIHEQLGVLGVVAQDNRRRNSPADSTNPNQNQSGRTENQSQNGRNPPNRPPQNNRWR